MRRGIGLLAVMCACLSFVASSAASNLCVPNRQIPACGGNGADEPNIADAVNNANNSGDRILIGTGTYKETVNDMGKSLTFIGAGPTKTIVQGAGSPDMTISSHSTVSNLGIKVYPTGGNTGLSLAGNATNVAVSASAGVTYADGLVLNGGSFTHGSIVLPTNVSDLGTYGGALGSGQISDSTITAPVGVTGDASGNVPVVRRVRIVANQGVLDTSLSPATVDDALVRTVPGPALETGLAVNGAEGSLVARHDTVIGSGSTGSTGLIADSNAGPPLFVAANTAVTLESSIIRGYGHSIAASAVAGLGPPDTAVTIVSVHHSFYDPGTETTSAPVPGPPSANAAIVPDSHSGNFDPPFVNAATGDFHLRAGSPAIDAGEPSLAAGESTTDLDGHARATVGHKGDAAVSDIGAFEFSPHAPAVRASASASRIAGGKRVRFTALGSDPSPGDTVSFSWHFDDGSSATGAVVSHVFTRAGRHSATVTATDLDRFTAMATVTVTVTGPSITRLKLKPTRFRAGARATISYRDTQAAKTTFEVFRIGSRRAVATFTHRDNSGRDSVHFAGKRLSPGRYRVQAIPRNKAGAGKAVSVRFRIIR